MATPAAIAGGATCFRCVPDQQSAILYLLATIAGVTSPSIIAANATCYRCVPDFESAMLYLLDTIATNAAAAAGQVSCGDVAPTTAPTNACTLYYDRVTTALYYWNATTATWILKV